MNKTNLVFLDTETTGAGSDDRLCQVGFKFNGVEVESLFKPPIPISIDAMSVCHITNKMVADSQSFSDSQMKKDLENIFAQENILVAHNAKFDVDMLRREGVEVKNIIDTYKVAQYLDEKSEIPRYNLQYLRYYYEIEIEDAIAHSALGDVRVLEKVFEKYFDQMMRSMNEESRVLQEMIDISNRPIMVKKFNFGKYNNAMVAEVAANDAGYLRWLLNEKIKLRDQGGENDENWIFTLQHYLGQSSNQMQII